MHVVNANIVIVEKLPLGNLIDIGIIWYLKKTYDVETQNRTGMPTY